MTCSEFENLHGDLVRDRLRNAITRKQALAHALACEACGKRLTTQRELNLRLFELAEATRYEHPPLRIKQQLREALADLQVAPKTKFSVRTGFKFPWLPNWQWVAFAAATVIILFSILLIGQRPNELSRGNAGGDLADKAFIAPEVLPPQPLISPSEHFVIAEPDTKHRVARRKRLRTTAPMQPEFGFAFVPLTLGTDERALANGMLVRMEVPRAQLIALGLPLGIEADREMVNAEVMMGEDGVAYAIRVLR